MAGCQYRCRRDRLAPHYVSFHKLSEAQAGKYIPENWMDPNNKNCPVIKCNYCSHQAHPILLRIHLFQTHMKGIFYAGQKKSYLQKSLFELGVLTFSNFYCLFLNPKCFFSYFNCLMY